MLFSVIIPTYNRERFVTKALESVFAQTFTGYEVIVVDDGSTDGTKQALAPYEGRIRYRYQPNRGVSTARNAGIGGARGEWVAFLDSDDEWQPEYLAAQAAAIKAAPGAVAHVMNAVTVFPDGRRNDHFGEIGLLSLFKDKERLAVDRPLQTIIGHGHWFLQSSVMRRDVLLQAGLFDPELSIAEDLDVMARMALQGPFSFCRKVLVSICRRQEDTENLAQQAVKQGIATRLAFGKVYGTLLQRSLEASESWELSRTLASNWRALGNIFLRAGRTADARYYYRLSFSLAPSVQALVKYLATFLHHRISVLFIRKGRHILPGEQAR